MPSEAASPHIAMYPRLEPDERGNSERYEGLTWDAAMFGSESILGKSLVISKDTCTDKTTKAANANSENKNKNCLVREISCCEITRIRIRSHY